MIMLSRRAALGAMVFLLAVSCTDSSTGPRNQPAGQLKDIVASSVASPYYHFEYDSIQRVRTVSFASDLRRYDIIYGGDGRIVQMKSINGRQDHLDYVYDSQGRVDLVKYVDPAGEVYTVLSLFYDGSKLRRLERAVRVTGGFIIDKTMEFTYYVDGNLEQITDHRAAVDSVQTESTVLTRFEQYDSKINVDGFDLIHNDFSDHLVLLPGVQLQKNNPARESLTAYGLNYVVDYTYTYDGRNRPLSKAGVVTVTQGSDPVTVVQIRTDYSYYQ